MTDVYITGASGVIGSELTLHFLAQQDHRVGAVSRRPCPLLPPSHPAQITVANPFDATWFSPRRADATIIHCAGLSDPRQEFDSFATLARDHILPHVAMVEALLDRGWKGRLIYFSSGGAVYGNTLQLPIPETHPTSPISFYGLHKLCLERALEHLARSRGFELIILRVANPYGAAVSKLTQGVIPILFRAYQTGSLFNIIGDGTAQRDYLEVTDLCHAVSLCLAHRMQEPTLTLNIGSGEGTALNALIAMIGGILNRKLRTRHLEAVHDVQSNILCRQRAHEVLGWQPLVPLSVGLQRYLARTGILAA
ncbi:MAG: NAD-dependent epimerase/dehydratase family protein [Rhodobacterales bacterium]|nr:NAD-dependent epimerase/dehydratase family protein [Rhodobacterales bacterium]MDX5412953.1 NAD-dependent epimerase/dehydratase family protein [Rhodobacterales bacterium]